MWICRSMDKKIHLACLWVFKEVGGGGEEEREKEKRWQRERDRVCEENTEEFDF